MQNARPDPDALPEWLYAFAVIGWLIGFALRCVFNLAREICVTLWIVGGWALYVAIAICAAALGLVVGLPI